MTSSSTSSFVREDVPVEGPLHELVGDVDSTEGAQTTPASR